VYFERCRIIDLVQGLVEITYDEWIICISKELQWFIQQFRKRLKHEIKTASIV